MDYVNHILKAHSGPQQTVSSKIDDQLQLLTEEGEEEGDDNEQQHSQLGELFQDVQEEDEEEEQEEAECEGDVEADAEHVHATDVYLQDEHQPEFMEQDPEPGEVHEDFQEEEPQEGDTNVMDYISESLVEEDEEEEGETAAAVKSEPQQSPQQGKATTCPGCNKIYSTPMHFR